MDNVRPENKAETARNEFHVLKWVSLIKLSKGLYELWWPKLQIDVEVELYEENIGTTYSTSDEMDNFRTVRMQVSFNEPTHNSLQETTSELQKCYGPFRNTLRSLAGDVNCEMPIEAGPDSAQSLCGIV